MMHLLSLFSSSLSSPRVLYSSFPPFPQEKRRRRRGERGRRALKKPFFLSSFKMTSDVRPARLGAERGLTYAFVFFFFFFRFRFSFFVLPSGQFTLLNSSDRLESWRALTPRPRPTRVESIWVRRAMGIVVLPNSVSVSYSCGPPALSFSKQDI